ncbi:MAG TPA: CGNR zinc finger domain-containing protein [Bryobacteraceae bacterium]|nr:CGNR zinc finger domain-containing protein [Bryobacteraceae bacterium]
MAKQSRASSHFILVSKNLAVDFANTIVDPHGEPAGAIRSWPDLIAFLEIAAAMPHDQSRRYREWPKRDPRDCSATFALALKLRDEIRAILQASAAGGKIRGECVETINHIFADQAGRKELLISKGSWKLTRVADKGSSSEILLAIAESAAEIVTQGSAANVRKCANADCVLYFQDRAHRRRWCSMAICGNRAKVAAHARRQKS